MSCIPPRGFTYDSTASSPTTAPYKRPPSVSGRSRPDLLSFRPLLGRALPNVVSWQVNLFGRRLRDDFQRVLRPGLHRPRFAGTEGKRLLVPILACQEYVVSVSYTHLRAHETDP